MLAPARTSTSGAASLACACAPPIAHSHRAKCPITVRLAAIANCTWGSSSTSCPLSWSSPPSAACTTTHTRVQQRAIPACRNMTVAIFNQTPLLPTMHHFKICHNMWQHCSSKIVTCCLFHIENPPATPATFLTLQQWVGGRRKGCRPTQVPHPMPI
jgi:hypothetical protein